MEKDIESLPELICREYSFKHHDPKSLSPLTLAFIGDTVFDLIVRTRVIENGNAPVNKRQIIYCRKKCRYMRLPHRNGT